MPDQVVVNGVPFLLCIPTDRRGNAIEKLAKYQKRKYDLALDWKDRVDLPEIPVPEIATPLPVNVDERERELENMMAKPPSHQARVK
jgi:hypothetical protein